jgi:hypothetical protein
MQSGLSIWMTDLNLMFLSFRRCFMDHLHLLVQNGLPIQHLGSRHRNVRMFLALTGIRGSVKTRTYARTVVSMASAVSAGVDTEQKTTRNARLHSKLAQEKEELMTTEQVREAKEGPRSLGRRGEKRKAEQDLVPKFRRGYAWGDSSTKNISPSALYTETAPPLPSPPEHLINDPIIQATIKKLGDHIKVETPFDVDNLESLLTDHPNPPLVQSALRSLREGFWLLSDGEWKIEVEEVSENYPMDDADLNVLRAFRDKEQSLGRWSQEVQEMLPGMKISPMFVAWQHGKPRIITDHSASELNAEILREDAKVRYDDMHDFGQALHDARLANIG